jgi:uncharacterized Zn-binding protein involved in type VI secretion
MPGVCRLGDKSKAPIDAHGCPACPHPNVQGPSIVASANVFINGMPGLRINDMGIHSACCGANMWMITGASGQVFLNGAQLVRQGDPTLHCGGPGQMIEASGNVHDGSPMVAAGQAGKSPVVNLAALDGPLGPLGIGGPLAASPGGGPGAMAALENRVAEYSKEIGSNLATGIPGAGLGAMEKVIKKKVIDFSEAKGIKVPAGAETAAKAFKWGGRGVDMAINVVPDLVHGNTHDAIKHAVSTGAGIAAGSAVGGACEAGAIVGTAGLGTPACVAADVATSTAVSFVVGKAYDPAVHLGGKAVGLAGKGISAIGGLFK